MRSDFLWNDLWMDAAFFYAQKAYQQEEIPVGAVVIFQGKIIAKSANEKESKKNAFLHAEILCLQKASQILNTWRLTECLLVVTLEPCLMCLSACQQFRIGRVVYGTPNKKSGALSLSYSIHQDKRLNHQFECDLMKKRECEEILIHFFQSKRLKQKNSLITKELI